MTGWEAGAGEADMAVGNMESNKPQHSSFTALDHCFDTIGDHTCKIILV